MREKDTDHSTPDCSPGVTRLDTDRKGAMMEVRRHSDDSNDVVEHREHFGKLKDSTSSFLQTLDKWRKDTDFSLYPLPFGTIVTRSLVFQYVEAFEVGMTAAQDGFSFATKGLSYKDLDISNSTTTELESYISEMQSLATQGKEKSERALESMRELRRKLNMLQDRMEAATRNSGTRTMQNEITIFEANSPILLQFEECMNWYIAWWTKTGMTASHQETNVAQYSRSGGDLRFQGIQIQWYKLQSFYSNYRIDMQRLQDRYLGVFKLVRHLNPSDLVDISTYPIPAAVFDTTDRKPQNKNHGNITIATTPPTTQDQPNRSPNDKNQKRPQVPAKNPSRNANVSKSVPDDKTPISNAEEPPVQEGTIASDPQKFGEPSKHSKSRKGRMNEPTRSGTTDAPVPVPHSSGRGTRKPSADGQESNKNSDNAVSTTSKLPLPDNSSRLPNVACTADRGNPPEQKPIGSEKGSKSSQSKEKGGSVSVIGHESKLGQGIDVLNTGMSDSTPTVTRRTTNKMDPSRHANISAGSVRPIVDEQIGKESTQQHIATTVNTFTRVDLTKTKKATETVPLHHASLSAGEPYVHEDSAPLRSQRSKGPDKHSDALEGGLRETLKSENTSSPRIEGCKSSRHPQNRSDEAQQPGPQSVIPTSSEPVSLDDPLALFQAAWTMDEGPFLKQDATTSKQQSPEPSKPAEQKSNSDPHPSAFRNPTKTNFTEQSRSLLVDSSSLSNHFDHLQRRGSSTNDPQSQFPDPSANGPVEHGLSSRTSINTSKAHLAPSPTPAKQSQANVSTEPTSDGQEEPKSETRSTTNFHRDNGSRRGDQLVNQPGNSSNGSTLHSNSRAHPSNQNIGDHSTPTSTPSSHPASQLSQHRDKADPDSHSQSTSSAVTSHSQPKGSSSGGVARPENPPSTSKPISNLATSSAPPVGKADQPASGSPSGGEKGSTNDGNAKKNGKANKDGKTKKDGEASGCCIIM